MSRSGRQARKPGNRSRVYDQNAAISIENPLRNISRAKIEQQASEFANLISPGDPDLVPLFSKAALLAQQPYTPNYDLGLGLTEPEKHALQHETDIGLAALSRQTKAFKSVVVLLFLCAITQGWAESIVSGANIPLFDFAHSTYSDKIRQLVSTSVMAVSVIVVYSFISPLANGYIGHRVYMNAAVLLCYTAGVVGAFAVNWEQLLASRVLFSSFMTFNSYLVPTFVAETFPHHLRPSIIVGWQATNTLGICFGFLSYIIIDNISDNKVPTWRWQTASVALPALTLMLLVWAVPESPLSLLKQNRHQSAFDAMCLLRTTPLQAARDLFYASAQLSSQPDQVSDRNDEDDDTETVIKAPWYKNKVNWSRWWNMRYTLSIDGRTRKALLSACVVMSVQQILGLNTLMIYFDKIHLTYELILTFTRVANGFSFAWAQVTMSIVVAMSLFGTALLVIMGLLTTRAYLEYTEPYEISHIIWERFGYKQYRANLLLVLFSALEVVVLVLVFCFTHSNPGGNTGRKSRTSLNSLSLEELNYVFTPPRPIIEGLVKECFWFLRRAMLNPTRRTICSIWNPISQQGYSDIALSSETARASGSEDFNDYPDRNLDLSTPQIQSVAIEPHTISPQSLRLQRVLITIQKRSIVFHEWTSTRSLDRCLNHVEQRSTCKWNWWPMPIPNRPVYKCDMRVKWTCHCGRQKYQDVPKEDGKKLQQLNEARSSSLQQGHPCNNPQPDRTSRVNIWRRLFSSIAEFFHNSIQRLCGQGNPSRNVPVDTTGDSQPSSAFHISSETVKVARSSARQGESPSPEQLKKSKFVGTRLGIAESTDGESDFCESSLRLVLGTEGRKKRSLSIDQLRLDHYTRDHDAISSILVAYQKLRGCYKYWFSIFKLKTFVFTKFVKHGRRKVYSHQDRDVVPEADPDYEYNPGSMQPPCRERPPVHRSEFMCLLDVCPKPCLLRKLRWHDCNEPSTRSYLISRLPKKKTHWELESDDRSFAWGLECSFEISALRVLLWHVTIALACFGPWTWLEILPPKLAHSTGVPLALTAMGISAFWASAGILQPYNESPKDSLRAYGEVQAYSSYIHQGDIITTTFTPELIMNPPAQSPQSLYTPDLIAIEAGYLARETQ